MNKKILVVSILAVLMLLTIAFASTVTSNYSKTIRKESPLFGIRTKRIIRDKVSNLIRRFVGERLFFLPFQWIIKNIKTGNPTSEGYASCDYTCFWCK